MDLGRRSFLARAGLSAAAAGVLARSARSLADPVTGSVDWSGVRAQFDLAPDWINLGTFYVASHPRPVREAIEAYRRQIDANPLCLEEAMFEPGHERIPDRVKAALARYVGGRPEEIALTSNTTTGLAFFVRLKLTAGQGGDEVLPILWEDNYVSLLPGEKRAILARFDTRLLAGRTPVLELEGMNVDAVSVPVTR